MRCLDRGTHETLTNEDPSLLARVLVSFYKSYKGLRLDPTDPRNLKQLGLDEIIQVPMTLEDPNIELPYNIQMCLDKCLKLTTGSGPAAPH